MAHRMMSACPAGSSKNSPNSSLAGNRSGISGQVDEVMKSLEQRKSNVDFVKNIKDSMIRYQISSGAVSHGLARLSTVETSYSSSSSTSTLNPTSPDNKVVKHEKHEHRNRLRCDSSSNSDSRCNSFCSESQECDVNNVDRDSHPDFEGHNSVYERNSSTPNSTASGYSDYHSYSSGDNILDQIQDAGYFRRTLPSECTRSGELAKKCNQSMDIIVAAKDRQAAEANKNATILLEELDKEKEKEEAKLQAMQRKRERRKQKKKAKQEEKRTDKDCDDDEDDSTGGKDREDDDDDDDMIINGRDPGLGRLASLVADVSLPVTESIAPISSAVPSGANLESSPGGGLAPTISGSSGTRSASSVDTPTAVPLLEPPSATTTSTTGHNLAKYSQANGQPPPPAASKKKKKKTKSAVRATESQQQQQQQQPPAPVPVPFDLPVTSPPTKLAYGPPTTFTSLSSATTPTNSRETPHFSATTNGSTTTGKTRGGRSAPRALARELQDDTGFQDNAADESLARQLAAASEAQVLSPTGAATNNQQMSSGGGGRSRGSPRKGRSGRGNGNAGGNNQAVDDEWKVVVPKRVSISVPKKDIGKVIGQAGTTINSIRNASGAHIDIDNKETDIGERSVHIRGSADSVNKAKLMIEHLMAGKAQKDVLAQALRSPGRTNTSAVSQQTPSRPQSAASTTAGTPSRSRRNGGGAGAQTTVTSVTTTTPTPTASSSKPLPIRRLAPSRSAANNSSQRSTAQTGGTSEPFASVYGLTAAQASSPASGEMNFASVAAAGILPTPSAAGALSLGSGSSSTAQTSSAAGSQPLAGFPTISESLAFRDSAGGGSSSGQLVSAVTCTSAAGSAHLQSANAVVTASSPSSVSTSMPKFSSSNSSISCNVTASSSPASAPSVIGSHRAFSRAPGSERHRTPERERAKAQQQQHHHHQVVSNAAESEVSPPQMSPPMAASGMGTPSPPIATPPAAVAVSPSHQVGGDLHAANGSGLSPRNVSTTQEMNPVGGPQQSPQTPQHQQVSPGYHQQQQLYQHQQQQQQQQEQSSMRSGVSYQERLRQHQQQQQQQQAAALAAAAMMQQAQAKVASAAAPTDAASLLGGFLDYPNYMSRGDMMTLPRVAPSLNPGASSFEPRPKPMENASVSGLSAAQAQHLLSGGGGGGSPYVSPRPSRPSRASPPFSLSYVPQPVGAGPGSGGGNPMALNNLFAGTGDNLAQEELVAAMAQLSGNPATLQAMAANAGPRPIGSERRRAPIGAERSHSGFGMGPSPGALGGLNLQPQQQQQPQPTAPGAGWQAGWNFDNAGSAGNPAAMVAAAQQQQQQQHVDQQSSAPWLGFNFGCDQTSYNSTYDQWNQQAPQ